MGRLFVVRRAIEMHLPVLEHEIVLEFELAGEIRPAADVHGRPACFGQSEGAWVGHVESTFEVFDFFTPDWSFDADDVGLFVGG